MYLRRSPLSMADPFLAEAYPTLTKTKPRALFGSSPTATTPPTLGTIQRIEHEMNQILSSNDEAQRWGVNGSLQDRLEIRRFMSSPGWAPNIPFRSANYQRCNKCNVFALDLGWRCGFNVPVISYDYANIGRRYTFPLANQLTTYAQRVFDRGSTELIGADGTTRWGWVETGNPRTETNAYIDDGWFYILVGWRRSGTGHVGVIRRIDALTKNPSGGVQSISYEGWEATSTRASHLTGREWRTTQCSVTTSCQSGSANTLGSFCAIHIICLDWQPDQAQRAVQVAHVNKCRLN